MHTHLKEKRCGRTCVAAMVLCALAQVVSAAPLLYVNTLQKQFGVVDLATGAYTHRGSTPEVLVGLGTLKDVIYGIDALDRLVTIDAQNGTATVIGPTGIPGSDPNGNIGAIPVFTSLATGELFAFDWSNNLYSIDPATGGATFVGATGIPKRTGPFGSVAAAGGTTELYYIIEEVLSPENPAPIIPGSIYRIDPTTGASQLVTGDLAALPFTGAAFAEGSIYAFRASLGGQLPPAQIWRLDPSSGAVLSIIDQDPALGDVFGGVAAEPIPEPGSVMLVLTGLIAIAMYLKKYRVEWAGNSQAGAVLPSGAWAMVLLAISGLGAAQESQIWVRHDANNLEQQVAPGAIFAVGVSGLVGPLQTLTADSFPLPVSLAGITLRVIVGGFVTEAFLLSTDEYKVRAMLPSNTPTGQGEVQLTVNGRSYSAPIRIARRQFGMYVQQPYEAWWPRTTLAVAQSVNAQGRWSGNKLTDAAQPGEFVVLWGTGLGAVDGDERAGPVPGADFKSDLELIIGNQRAEVLYAGRSGCCAGVDQIVARVPSGVEGCFVPVWVRLRDTDQTDQVHIAIRSGGGTCGDLPPDVAEKLDARRALNLGFISLGKGAVFGPGPYVVQPKGTCRMGAVPAGDIEFSYSEYTRATAGTALHVQTPQGSESWHWSPWAGAYLGQPSPQGGTSTIPGEYAIHNGGGGYNVGPFEARFTVPPLSFHWTNRNEVDVVRRAEGVTITWSGGDPEHGSVSIIGGTAFTCVEDAARGMFTVPSYVLSAIRPGERIELTVAFQAHPGRLRFQAPGVDFAYSSYHISSSRTVVVE